MIIKLNSKSKYLGICLILMAACGQISVQAQSYIGHAMDNYAGVHSIIYNPANVFDSPYKSDINLVSASSYLGSDYLGLSFSDLISGGEFEFDIDAKRYPTDTNHFFANIDVLGPSFMVNLGEKQSIGLTTRVRGIFNLNNIDGNLYERISDGFEIGNDFSFDSKNLNITAHVFAEIGVTYGREILNTQDQFLKGGVTLKYLMGAGGLFANSPELSGDFNGTTNFLNTQGNLAYGTTPGFESDSPEFSDLQSGFGVDLGVVYEYRKRMMDDAVRGKRVQNYKFKIALAITDIGSINYNNSEITEYDVNGTVNALEFETKDFEEVLEDNYTGTTTTGNQKLQLPTALQIMTDYYIGQKWYVGLHTSLSMRKSGTGFANNTINTATLAPRWESKWISVYSPLGLRQYGDFAWGLGFRLGPLTIGSGSILTNLISDNSKNADVYVGLKVPLYKNITY